MKKLILASFVASLFAFSTLPVYAQMDNDAVAQKASIDSIIDVLNNVTPETTSEQLINEIAQTLNKTCTSNNKTTQNDNKNKSDENSPTQNEKNLVLDGVLVDNTCCNTTNIDILVRTVVDEFGAESPLISDFLTGLSSTCSNSDAITLAAINAGVDATTASEATAAGPGTGQPAAPVSSLPTLPTPTGSGGTGGDNGISEGSN